jgi:antirestriction protein ArdC
MVSTVPLEMLAPSVAGYYSPDTKQIVVAEHSQRQMTKTLAHELGHHIARVDDRAENECIAEGIAYVVCAHFGLDTGERSFPYVAGWSKDTSVLKNVLSTIQSASATLIDGVAAAMPGNDP